MDVGVRLRGLVLRLPAGHRRLPRIRGGRRGTRVGRGSGRRRLRLRLGLLLGTGVLRRLVSRLLLGDGLAGHGRRGGIGGHGRLARRRISRGEPAPRLLVPTEKAGEK